MTKKDIVIFGASQRGKEVSSRLCVDYNIVAFCDNDKDKWGTEFCGLEIIPPERLKELDDVLIVIASMYYHEISTQLYEMGLRNVYFFRVSLAEIRIGTYTLLRMCDLSIINNLHANAGDGALFASDFERIFDKLPAIDNKQEIIYREKNVLFFAYFFPPIGSSGVQRSLKFVKYLKELGWNPIVVSCGKFSRDIAFDESMLSEIPNDITVIRIDDPTTYVDDLTAEEMHQVVNLLHGGVNNYGAMKAFIDEIKKDNGSNREFLLHPQKVTMWVLNVLAKVPQLIDFNKIDALFVTSGPYLSSLIGYYLKNKYNKPCVMDFRDPWTQRIKTEPVPDWVMDFEFALEKNMLVGADKIISLSPICSDDYKNIFGVPSDKIHEILNGYDEADFETVDVSNKGPSDKLKIIYNGAVIENRSKPVFFINAVNEAICEGLINKADIEIEFVGERKPITIEDEIKAADVYNIVNLKPYTEHIESLRNLANANILLIIVLDVEGATNMYTGKIFEYLRMKRRILALVPENCLLGHILDETGTGVCYHPGDKEGIKNYLRTTLDEIRGGVPLNVNAAEIEKYERKDGSIHLAEILDGLIK